MNTDPSEETRSWSLRRKTFVLLWGFFSEGTLCLVVSGWPAFLPVLVSDGAYFEYCTANTSHPYGIGDVQTCTEQLLQLSVMSTVALGVQNTCAPIAAVINDSWGPRMTTAFGAVAVFLGYLLLGFANSQTFDVYILAWSLLAVGGGFALLCSKHLANLFPANRELLLSIFFGLAHSSNGILYLFQILYFRAGLSFRFICIMLISLAVSFAGFSFVQPRVPVIARAMAKKESFPFVFQDVKEVLKSVQLWVLVQFTVVTSTTTYFYLIAFSDILSWLFPTDPQLCVDLASQFSLIFVVFPLFCGPFIGILIQKFWLANVIFFAMGLLVLNTVLTLIPNEHVQLVNFFVFILARAAVWCLTGSYCNIMFGRFFSISLAMGFLSSGAFLFTVVGWQKLTLFTLKGDYLYVILGMGGMNILCCLFLAGMIIKWKRGGPQEGQITELSTLVPTA